MVRQDFKCGQRKRALERVYERAVKEMWKNQGGEVSGKTKTEIFKRDESSARAPSAQLLELPIQIITYVGDAP